MHVRRIVPVAVVAVALALTACGGPSPGDVRPVVDELANPTETFDMPSAYELESLYDEKWSDDMIDGSEPALLARVGAIRTLREAAAEEFGADGLARYDAVAAEYVDAKLAEAEVEAAVKKESQWPNDGLSWGQAVNHVGTTQRVCGPLMSMRTSDDDVFLNLGRDYPDSQRFTIVLWDIGGVKSVSPGLTICANGPITSYNGVAQIELRSLDRIEIWE
mgnify:CR=1 FL=1